MRKPLLLGHRGARGVKGIRENTLPAFDLALARGCDGFEFDVQLTADGWPVVGHDAEIGGFEIARSSAQALKLPLLSEVLARYHNSAFLDIELKVPGLETITIDLLREHVPTRGFVVSSFLPEVLETMHSQDAKVPLGLICETRVQLGRWSGSPVEYVIPHFRLVEPGLFGEISAMGKKTLVWTVNAPADMRRFADWGVDGIISDDPEQLSYALGRRSEAPG